MYNVIKRKMKSYYKSAYIDANQISKLTLNDFSQWDNLIIQSKDEKIRWDYSLNLLGASVICYDTEHNITNVLVSDLIKDIQNKVKKLQNEFGDAEVILYKRYKYEGEGVGYVMNGYNTKPSKKITSKNNCPIKVNIRKMF